MIVKRISIRNILGIEELQVEPGRITKISGKNGSGKTSFLEAIRALLGGGHDATLIRKGSETGEIVMLLEDGVEIRRRISDKRSTLDVRRPDGKIGKPQEYLARLFDGVSFNPVRFIGAKPEDRIEALLDVLPILVMPHEITEAAPDAKTSGRLLPEKYTGRSAIEAVAIARESVYEQRTEVNALAKDKLSTADELQRQLVPQCFDTPDIERLRADRDTLMADSARSDAEAKQKVATEMQAFGKTLQADRDVANQMFEATIAKASALRVESDRMESEAHAAKRLQMAEWRNRELEAQQEAQESAKQIASAYTGANRLIIDRLDNDIREAEAIKERIAKERDLQRLAESSREQADNLRRRSAILTNQIDRLDVLRDLLIKKIPIPGAEISAGEILLDGISFPRLNLAKKIRFSLDVARIRCGEIPFVVFDDCEHLDSEHLAEFEAQAEEMGLQLIYTQVSDAEFSVETKG